MPQYILHSVKMDAQGNPIVLAEGSANSKREFIHGLAKEKFSFQDADLKSCDLRNIDFTRANLHGANLAQADLRGCTLSYANLRETNLSFTSMQGTTAERASFEGAKLFRTDLSGAKLAYSNFRGCEIKRAVFTGSTASSTIFSHATIERANFSNMRLINADFGNSTVINCDFSSSLLGHKIFSGESEEMQRKLARHLPERTRRAIIIGCKYDKKTVLNETVRGFIFDRRSMKMTKLALSTALTLGLAYFGVNYAEPLIHSVAHSEALVNAVGHDNVVIGTTLVALAASYEMAKELATEHIEEKALHLIKEVRETAKKMTSYVSQRAHIVASIFNGNADPLLKALEAKRKDAKKHGFLNKVKMFFSDFGQVIVCDRRHMALALGALSANRKKDYELPNDITIVRYDKDIQDDKTPMSITFLRSGNTLAVWPVRHDGVKEFVTTRYDEDGNLSGCWNGKGSPIEPNSVGLPETHINRLDTAYAMELGILNDHELCSFSYPRETHYIQAGQDGSVIVRRGSDRKVDNPHRSPAILFTDNNGYHARQGSIEGEHTHDEDCECQGEREFSPAMG